MKFLRTCALAGVALTLSVSAAMAAKAPKIEKQSWPFGGIFGTYDEAQLQRGFQVYRQNCSACHSLKRIAFRNLTGPGGPNFPEDQVKALAEEYFIKAGPNDEGEMFERPGRLSDYFPPLYPNEQAARVANGGAYPPDMSLLAKARGIPHADGVITHILTMGQEVLTGYQEAGADYIYALMTNYKEPPEDFDLQDGLYYNASYPGKQIAMAQPLYEDGIEYQDGTPATIENQAKDISAFLMWAADPHLNERKQMGWMVMIYLLITAALLYVAKRTIWSKVKH